MTEPLDAKALAEWALRVLVRMRELDLHQQAEVIDAASALLRVQLQRAQLELNRRSVMIQLAAQRPELLAPPIRDEET